MVNLKVKSNNFIDSIKQLYVTFLSNDDINENSLDYYANIKNNSSEDIENAKIAEQLKKSLAHISQEISEKIFSEKATTRKSKDQKTTQKVLNTKKAKLPEQLLENKSTNNIKSPILNNTLLEKKDISEMEK